MSHSVDYLLEKKPYELEDEERVALFWPALMENLAHHVASSQLFAKWAKHLGWHADGRPYSAMADLPYIPAQAFKKLELLSVPASEIVDVRNSSSTSSGTPSVVARDELTLARYKKSRTAVLNDHCKPSRPWQIGVTYDPARNPNPRLSANLVVSVIAGRTTVGMTQYVVREDGDKATVDCDLFLDLVEKHGAEIGLIFGQTAYLYLFLIAELKRRDIRLKLTDAILLYGWGWKSFASQAVSTEQFMADVEEYLGIPQTSVLDMYGFAESNTLYLECTAGYRHVPLWEDILVRDPITLEPVGKGQEGLLQFLSAIPNSYPGLSILADDIGISATSERCSCGRHGPAFKIVRRARPEEVAAMVKRADELVSFDQTKEVDHA